MQENLWEKFQHYVHITSIRQDKYIEFEYSIGDSELYCEMVLPKLEFDRFCRRRLAIPLPKEEVIKLELDRLKWKYGEPGVAC